MTNYYFKDDIPIELELELRIACEDKREYQLLTDDGIVRLEPDDDYLRVLCFETNFGFFARLVAIRYPIGSGTSNYRFVTRYHHRFRSFLVADLWKLNHSPLILRRSSQTNLLEISNDIMSTSEI